jgi:hypothetical protein
MVGSKSIDDKLSVIDSARLSSFDSGAEGRFDEVSESAFPA